MDLIQLNTIGKANCDAFILVLSSS